MKTNKHILFLAICFCYFGAAAQSNSSEYRGTIKVEKKDFLSKVQYDNVNYKLVGIDQYGNVLDSAIREFEMKTTIKGIAYSEKTTGSYLTYQMQKIIGRCDEECSLLFTNIVAKDKNGNVLKMKPFTYTFGRKKQLDEQ